MKTELKKQGFDKKKIRINGSQCLETCEAGPSVVIYPEQTWYSPKTPEDGVEIVQKHVLEGEVVTRLLMDASLLP